MQRLAQNLAYAARLRSRAGGFALTAAMAVAALLAAGASGSAVSRSGQGAATIRADFAEAARAARLLAVGLQAHASLPGISLSVGVDGQLAFSGTFGMADLETVAPASPLTRFRIGSISKSLTAAGAMLLAERGRLDLDAPVSRYVPSIPGDAGRATVRQVAGHLAGIRHYADGEGIGTRRYANVADALDIFIGDPLVAPPGTKYSYSTYGYTLLSAVMQAAADQPFLEWMERHVFGPLDMTGTGADLAGAVIPQRAAFFRIADGRLAHARITDNSYKWAGGGFLSTADDLVRFGNALLSGRLLSNDGVRVLFTSQRTIAGDETGYAMGFRPRRDWEGRAVVHHGGSSEGSRAFLLLYPAERVVIAMAANRENAPLFEQEAQSVAHFFLEHRDGRPGALDEELAGGWTFTGNLGKTAAAGELRLFDAGQIRGFLTWGTSQAPLRVLLVDRHDEELQLMGVGPHGVMNMWLDPGPGGFNGRWEYLGDQGEVRLRTSVLPERHDRVHPGGPDGRQERGADRERQDEHRGAGK